MRGVVVVSIFLVVHCMCAVINAELVRDQPSTNVLKLSISRKSLNSQRRFRRDAKHEEDEDVVNVGGDGKCDNPTVDESSKIEDNPVSLVHFAVLFFVYKEQPYFRIL